MNTMNVDNTDLEVVAYINAGGNLVLRVNKAGICVVDVGVRGAAKTFTNDELMGIGARVQPVLRDLSRPGWTL